MSTATGHYVLKHFKQWRLTILLRKEGEKEEEREQKQCKKYTLRDVANIYPISLLTFCSSCFGHTYQWWIQGGSRKMGVA